MEVTQGQLLVPIPDACRILGYLGRTKVYELVNNGELTKVSIGRRGYITAASIEAYVNRLSESATA
jgi:helix-turn-helix protein